MLKAYAAQENAQLRADLIAYETLKGCYESAEQDLKEAEAEIARLKEALTMAYEWEKDCPTFEAVCPKCQWKKKAEAALRPIPENKP